MDEIIERYDLMAEELLFALCNGSMDMETYAFCRANLEVEKAEAIRERIEHGEA